MNEQTSCITINCKCCGEETGNTMAVPVIGENKNWWIGDQDTGIAAQGPAGADGAQGEKGEAGVPGPAGPQGPSGSFTEMDTLFDGTADTIGETYPMAKPITDYKALAIEIQAHYPDDPGNEQGSRKTIIWAIDPKPSEIRNEYFLLANVDEISSPHTGLRIGFHFPDANSVKVDAKQTTRYVDAIRVAKIYGMK